MAPSLQNPFRPGSRRTPWLAPLVGLAVVGTAVAVPMVANADPKLPDRTAAQLLVDLSQAGGTPMSGTVVETARLGLPSLPEVDGAAITPTSLLSGSHTAHVWYDGKGKLRVALVGSLAETDVVANGRDLWMWTSGPNTAQHAKLPADTPGRADAADSATGSSVALSLTPAQAAAKALTAIDPTTVVRVDGTATVAGRSAYELVLVPKDSRSLVGDVRLAVDSKTGVPLRVQIHAAGSTGRPAFETAFTSVSFSTPSASVFRFTPPPGAKVSELGGASKAGASLGGSAQDSTGKDSGTTDAAGAKPTVVGTSWTSVAVLPGGEAMTPGGLDNKAGKAGKGGTGSGSAASLLSTVQRAMTPVSGSWGSGQLLRTKLVSVLVTSDGRLLIGAVTPATLEQVAAG